MFEVCCCFASSFFVSNGRYSKANHSLDLYPHQWTEKTTTWLAVFGSLELYSLNGSRFLEVFWWGIWTSKRWDLLDIFEPNCLGPVNFRENDFANKNWAIYMPQNWGEIWTPQTCRRFFPFFFGRKKSSHFWNRCVSFGDFGHLNRIPDLKWKDSGSHGLT